MKPHLKESEVAWTCAVKARCLRDRTGYSQVQFFGDALDVEVQADLVADVTGLHGANDDVGGVPVLYDGAGGFAGDVEERAQGHDDEDRDGLDKLLQKGPGGHVHKLGLIDDENNLFLFRCLDKGQKQEDECSGWDFGVYPRVGLREDPWVVWG